MSKSPCREYDREGEMFTNTLEGREVETFTNTKLKQGERLPTEMSRLM